MVRLSDGAKGVAIIHLNPPEVVHLTQWHWKEISSLHCNHFYGAFELRGSGSKFLSTFFLTGSYHLQKQVLQIPEEIITNNKNALDPCLTPPLETATHCSRHDAARLLKGTDITLSHSSRRFDAQHWCASALATSFHKGLCVYHRHGHLTGWVAKNKMLGISNYKSSLIWETAAWEKSGKRSHISTWRFEHSQVKQVWWMCLYQEPC